MRLVIDLQGCQSHNRLHSIGHYALSLATAIARNANEHEIWIVLNAALPQSVASIRRAFDGLIPKHHIQVFDIPAPVAEQHPANAWRARAAEMIREYFIQQLRPDAVFITSFFEGYVDDAVTSIGAGTLAHAGKTVVMLHDPIPPASRQNEADARKIASLNNAGLLLTVSNPVREQVIRALNCPPQQVVSLPDAPWDVLAQQTLCAIEEYVTAAGAMPVQNSHGSHDKPRLAFVSPLPPEKTGIANYSIDLLPALQEHFRIELITDQINFTLPPSLTALPVRSTLWFVENAACYDRILYQFGNSPFHTHMFWLLRKHPGVVVLHDFWHSHVLYHEEVTGRIPHAWADALYRSHGYHALYQRCEHRFNVNRTEEVKDAYPCNLEVLQNARGVIVHSEYSRNLARKWYGDRAAGDWTVIPHVRMPVATVDYENARKTLQLRKDAFVICSFGFVQSAKCSQRLVDAWLSSRLAGDERCELILVGANHPGDYGLQLTKCIRESRYGSRIRITGWADAAAYQLYLQAADVGVQLRSISRGETSGATLDCMNYSLPTIVNANGSLAELPENVIWKLPDAFSDAELIAALETLWEDPARRVELGSAARQFVHTQLHPQQCAAQFAKTINAAYNDGSIHLQELLTALAALTTTSGMPDTGQALEQLAYSIAASTARRVTSRQLLVDVSAISRTDLKTGIERVVRAQLFELLHNPPDGFRVEPVYLNNDNEEGIWHYRYANDYTCRLLKLDVSAGDDAPVDISPGDVFYSPDFYPAGTLKAAAQGLYADWRMRGVEINFLIHDILPILKPAFFPEHAEELHARWLECIALHADRLICISNAVADEVRAWLHRSRAVTASLEVVHHGADISATTPSYGLPEDAQPVLQQLTAMPSFLMVGTIEPRKGHLQTIAAFDKLWQEGQQVNLVIVGKEGWTPLAPDQRRTIPQIVHQLHNHPELGKRLFWLQDISDEYLQKIYTSCACLVVASEGEGFGLPLIEAAQCGLPVIARDLPVFREIAQQHAHYFTGQQADDLAEAVRAWLCLRENGKTPSSRAIPWRTWRDNVQELISVINLYQASSM